MLKRSDDSGHSCLALAFREKCFHFSSFSMMLTVYLLVCFLCSVSNKFFCTYIHQGSHCYWMLDVFKDFFCISVDDLVLLILVSLYVMSYDFNLYMLNHSHIAGMQSIWPQCMSFLMTGCIFYISVLLRILISIH